MIKQYQNSVIAQLLEAIISQVNFNGEPISNIGEILLSILEQTPYDKEPKSVLAELFLKLKDKLEGRAFTPYDKEPKSAIAEILLSILNETEYDKQPNSRIAELLLELKAELEDYAELTASGAIANFTTSVVKPLVNLTAYIEAVQEAGTPTPQSPKAISGVSAVNVTACGFNLTNTDTLNANWFLGNLNSDGTISGNNLCCYGSMVRCKPDTKYCLSTQENVLQRRIAWYDKNGNFLSRPNDATLGKVSTFVSPSNAYYMRFSLNCGGGIFTNPLNQEQIDTMKICLNESNTSIDGTFIPYNGNTTTIQLGQTVYGGYVEQDKEGHRQLVVTKAYNTINASKVSKYGTWDGEKGAFFYTEIGATGQNFSWRGQNNNDGVKCDVLEMVSGISTNTTTNGMTWYSSSTIIRWVDVNSMSMSIDDYKTHLSTHPINVIYELATPIVIDLPDGTPINTLSGVNNVYNDSGDTSVTYLALISDNITRGAKARATLKAEKQKVKEEKEQVVLDPIEVVKEMPKKGA